MSPLTFILGLPLAGALALAVVPRNFRFVMRLVALFVTLISLLLSFYVFLQFDPQGSLGGGSIEERAGFQFVQQVSWIESLGIHYVVGVDGISVGLVFLASLVAFAAVCVSWDIKTHEKEFYILLLLMSGGIIGAFASLDLFFFYFFHELALVPTFIMIGVWGRGERRNYATFKMTLYLSAGALVALVGLVALYIQSGAGTFNMVELSNSLQKSPLSLAQQEFIFPFLLFGFGILVSLWPFHTWAPIGYAAAPTATAMLHAGVLKKFGLYGLIRIALPMLPDAAKTWMPVLALLCLGNILHCGWVAMRQKDLNLLIGNSSVAHMGFAFLGIASLSVIGVGGTVLVMVAHGILAALTFALSGYLYNQYQSLQMEKFGGLLHRIPFIGTVMIMALLAGCGVPGFANFAGEILVFFAAWPAYTWITVAAVWGGLVIGGIYMLRAIRKVWHGPASESVLSITDASWWRRVPFVLLLGSLILFGVFPSLLMEKINPAAESIIRKVNKEPVSGPRTAMVFTAE